MLNEALRLIKSAEASCVVIKDDEIVYTANGRGVSPLLKIFADEPDKLKNAFVVDKIIGKAAAMILAAGGARRAHGVVMSAAGRDYLIRHGIIAEYSECVDMIANRDGTDICPIERSVIDIDDPSEGLRAIGVVIDKLRSK